MSEGEGYCFACGFALGFLDIEFGARSAVMERLADAAGVLTRKERHGIEVKLDRFEEQFPQLFISVYIGEAPAQAGIGEFAFWLLNRAAISEVDLSRPNDRGILLVIDPVRRKALLEAGYFIETILRREDLAGVLERAHLSLVGERYDVAIRTCVRLLTRLLNRRAKAIHKRAKGHEPEPRLEEDDEWAHIRFEASAEHLHQPVGREGDDWR